MSNKKEMVLETLTYEYMSEVMQQLIEYFEKGSLPKEQEVFKKLIITEFLIIQSSLGNVTGLINKLKNQLEESNNLEIPDSSISKIAQFMKLPKEEQNKLLKEQAEASVDYYAEDQELKEFRDADLTTPSNKNKYKLCEIIWCGNILVKIMEIVTGGKYLVKINKGNRESLMMVEESELSLVPNDNIRIDTSFKTITKRVDGKIITEDREIV